MTQRVEVFRNDLQESVRLVTFDRYYGLLFSIAYPMLGSVADARSDALCHQTDCGRKVGVEDHYWALSQI
jgi:hypothetical protein